MQNGLRFISFAPLKIRYMRLIYLNKSIPNFTLMNHNLLAMNVIVEMHQFIIESDPAKKPVISITKTIKH